MAVLTAPTTVVAVVTANTGTSIATHRRDPCGDRRAGLLFRCLPAERIVILLSPLVCRSRATPLGVTTVSLLRFAPRRTDTPRQTGLLRHASGSRTRKVVPCRGAVCNSIRPLWAAKIAAVIARPIPAPP